METEKNTLGGRIHEFRGWYNDKLSHLPRLKIPGKDDHLDLSELGKPVDKYIATITLMGALFVCACYCDRTDPQDRMNNPVSINQNFDKPKYEKNIETYLMK